ncbi:ABC transporter permease [Glycomyces paridis]|uniref:ABC transporter permease n=1 Tax=Glycomyces paridis TaxID=2126555 RepID=A0A4S8PTB8_9ACTN|nr:ABC transporter permease [Glycomyces paridis]THV31569.1 ABC transporter permease [Glycomyces paridis]
MTTAVAEIEDGLGTLAGTGKLLRFQLRRLRLYLAGWLVGLAGGTWSVAASFPGLYPDAAGRESFAVTVNTPAMRSMTGPETYIESYGASTGAMFAHQMILWTGALTAVMFILLVVRLTRADEETSRLEVFRSNPIGRRADLAAALLVALIAAVALGALMALSVAALPGDQGGSAILFGLAHTAVAVVFAGIAAVTAQMASFAASANGLAFAVLGWSALTAGVGNAQENWVVWLSPIGWAQETFVYTPEQRWWPIAFAAVVALLTVWAAFTLITHRDFGQGMLAGRPGPASAKPSLRSATALTFRLTRGMTWAGIITLALLGAAYGSVLGGADDMLDGLSDAERALLDQGGASIEDNVGATFAALNGLFATLFGLLVIGRARKEETQGRGELIAAGAVARSGWPGSYLAAALWASTSAAVAAGLFLGLAGSGSTGDWDYFGRLLYASVLQLPAAWTLTAFAFAAFAWLPRLGWLRWVAWVWLFVVMYFANLLDLPEWAQTVSPFHHLAAYPAKDIDWLGVALVTVAAAVLAALGYLGLRRRDLNFS